MKTEERLVVTMSQGDLIDALVSAHDGPDLVVSEWDVEEIRQAGAGVRGDTITVTLVRQRRLTEAELEHGL